MKCVSVGLITNCNMYILQFAYKHVHACDVWIGMNFIKYKGTSDRHFLVEALFLAVDVLSVST